MIIGRKIWTNIIVGIAALEDPSLMVVTGIAVDLPIHGGSCGALISQRGQLAILELKIRERGLGAYSEVVGEAKKMCRITGFSS